MKDIRCDYHTNHYISGNTDNGFLELRINEYSAHFGEMGSSIYLSRESTIELIKELVDQLQNIEYVEKSPLV